MLRTLRLLSLWAAVAALVAVHPLRAAGLPSAAAAATATAAAAPLPPPSLSPSAPAAAFLPRTSRCPPAQPLLFPHTPSGVLLPLLLTNPATLRVAQRISLAVVAGAQLLTVAVPEAKVFRPDAPILQLQAWRVWHDLLRSKTERIFNNNLFYSVTQKATAAPGTDSKHFYFSLAPYWWPDPGSSTGLPYIHLDGVRNPERDSVPDQGQFVSLVRDVHVLAMAWSFLGDEAAAERAVLLLSVWFLEAPTAMEPSLEHAQVRRGHGGDQGWYTGLLDLQKIVELIDSITLLLDAPAATEMFERDLRAWFARYLDWLLSDSPVMAGLAEAQGNHASWGALHICGVAAFLGRTDVVAARLADYAQRLLPLQILADGSQPLEESRPDSWHYVNYNLEAALQLATLSQNVAAWIAYSNKSNGSASTAATATAAGASAAAAAATVRLPDLFGCVSSIGGNSSLLGAVNQLVPFVQRAGGSDVRLWMVSHLQLQPLELKDVVLPLQLLAMTWDHPLYQRPDEETARRFDGLRYRFAYDAVAEAISPTIVGKPADLAWVKRVPPQWLKSATEIEVAMAAAEAANRLLRVSSSTGGGAGGPFIGVRPRSSSSTGGAGDSNGPEPMHSAADGRARVQGLFGQAAAPALLAMALYAWTHGGILAPSA